MCSFVLKKKILQLLTVGGILKSEHCYRFPYRLWNQKLNLRKWALTLSLLKLHSLKTRSFFPFDFYLQNNKNISKCSFFIKVCLRSQIEIIKRDFFRSAVPLNPKCHNVPYSAATAQTPINIYHSSTRLNSPAPFSD